MMVEHFLQTLLLFASYKAIILEKEVEILLFGK